MDQTAEVIAEIRTRMEKLDQVDEIVAAVESMRRHVGKTDTTARRSSVSVAIYPYDTSQTKDPTNA